MEKQKSEQGANALLQKKELNRGKVVSQIIEAARTNLDLLSAVKYGEVVFQIRDNNVYMMRVRVDKLFKDSNEKQSKEV